ncbi:MAG TPA: hypothetical protein VNY05_25990 [Candidatus Acidoferrales bacterium]|jgi:hypothetical protein|nr:hypothetical protein [Candidatus Acidoferrales bacterium]
MLRRFSICLAFATWCFLDTWIEYAEGGIAYFARQDPIRAVVIPIVCLEIILALVMFGVWEFCRRRRLDQALPLHFLFLALCFGPLGIASVAALRVLPFALTPMVRNPLFWPAVLTVVMAPLGLVCRRLRRATWLARSILLYSWPVLILVLVQAARGTLLKYPGSAYTDGTLAVPFESQPAHVRVVWIIFDELSQTIAFGNRPAELELPNLDRLKRGSFYASSAQSPAASTEISMPSLILGEQVIEASHQGPDALRVRTGSRPEPLAWGSMPNVFDAARDLGFNTALVGWFHPYGRLLNHSLTKCYWTAGWLRAGIEEQSNPQPLVNAMWERVRLQFAALPLVGHLPGVFPGIYHRQQKIERFSQLREHALAIVSDPSVGLALIHLPIPHPPAIYSGARGMLTAQGRIGYLDSVGLVDQTLGVLRRAMEQCGLWDRTAVLVSADHGWRTQLWRGDAEWTPNEEAASHQDTSGVPFLLKLPEQTSSVVYGKRFNTIVTRQLIMGILSSQLTDPGTLPVFIERHAHDPGFR